MSKKRLKKSKSKKSSSAKKARARIKIVGVGGAGCAVIDRLVKTRIPKLEFIAVNTDAKSLAATSAHRKVRLGRKATKGLGTGMDPFLGQRAAQESQKIIRESLKDADIIFFVAGLGGGTASGALPVILDLIKDLKILTIVLVTKPFTFEGSRRTAIAEQSFNLLANKADTLISLANENILQMIDRKTSLLDAFKSVDAILEQTIGNITEIVNFSGLINLDLADLKAVLSGAGKSLLGIGEADGEGRAVRAVRAAIDSPFFNLSFKDAKGIVFIVSGGETLSIHEINEAAKYIIGAVGSDCRVVFGVTTKPAMGDKVKVIVIATGFSSGPAPKLDSRLSWRPESEQAGEEKGTAVTVKPAMKKPEVLGGEKFKNGRAIPEPSDELEIPTFLRKKKII